MALDTHQFNLIRDDIRGHFRDYLSRRGYDASKQFKCPNPCHADKHPSAGVVKSHPAWGHCFACGCSFDIFTLCVWEESKPSCGAAWFKDVFLYLADKFNIVVPDLNLTTEDLTRMELANAYSHASQIVRSLGEKEQSAAVAAKLKQYGWGNDVRYQMGIGSIKSYDDYIARMTKSFGHKLDFLTKADLTNKNIFNENCLIYTIRDIDGQPVGFSARDLLYEQKEEVYQADLKAGKETKYRSPKYFHTTNNGNTVNGKVRETLFQKSEIVFNFDLAKKAGHSVVVMEGNADCVTAYAAGIHGAVAALGGAFQRSHIEQVIAAGKDHIILVFDSDKSGKDATKRAMKLVEEMSGKVGLRVEVLQLPDGFKDPDEYLRSFGDIVTAAREFRNLPRIDMFSWRLQMAIENGEDRESLCEQTIPLIVNEESNLVRQRMADQLAQVCEYDREIVRREVLRLTDMAAMKLDEQRTVVSQELLKKIRQNPTNLSSYLLDAQSALEAIDKKATGYDSKKVLGAAKDVYDQLLRNTSKYELKTGFTLFDDATGGIPRKGLFGTLPGKSHHGKSVWMDNLINGLINTNPDIIVVLHTVDDPQVMRVQRLLGARTGIASKFWRSSGYFLHEGKKEAPENFEERFNEAWDWYFRMMKEERLIVVDSSTLTPDLMTLRAFLADIQRQHPGKTIIFFGDNFHLYDLQTQETGEQKISKMSVFVTTEIIGGLGLSAIFTVEIPKGDFEPGHRPSYQNLKGTGRLTFDSKVNMTVYSQSQDWVSRPDKQLLYWESPLYQEEGTNGDGIVCMEPMRLPIVEIIIDKNKINGVTKTIFFRMDKFSGQMKECGQTEQDAYRDKLVAAAASEKAAWKSSKSKHHDN